MVKFVVFIVLSFFGIISFNNISKSAKFDDVNSIDIEKKLNDNLCTNDNDLSIEPYYAYFDFDTGMLSSDNIIECSIIDNCGSIPHISYDGNIIVEVLSQEINESKVKLTLPDFDACSNVTLTYNNWIKTINIYSSYGNDKYAISSYTPNKAINLIESISEDVLSSRMESIYVVTPDADSIDDINQNNRSSSMYGYLRWTDDQLNDHSLIGIKVELRCKNIFGNVVAQYYTYSNNIGYYQFDTSGLIFNWYEIHVIFMNDMISVNSSDDIVYDIKIKEGAIVYDVSNDLDIYDFDTSHSDHYYKYAQVFCAMYNYSNYAKGLNNNVNIPMCKIIYPTYTDPENSNNNDDGAYYASGGNTIHLGYDSQKKPGSPNVYASWDTIGHEYGHHLQKHFFNHNYGGHHYGNETCIKEYLDRYNLSSPLTETQMYDAKKFALGLSFKEAWASFFSISSQSTFSSDLKAINTVGDYNYHSFKYENGLGFYLLNHYYLMGETCELTICETLLRLWEDVETEDNIAISDYYLWYIMRNYNPDSFFEFYQVLCNDELININVDDVNKILEDMQICSYNIDVNYNDNYAMIPTFTWYCGNNDVSWDGQNYNFSNNKFIVSFYDINKNLLFEKNYLVTNSYTLTEDEWNQILSLSTLSYYVTVKSYATLGYVTGLYSSSYTRLRKSFYANYNISLTNQNYYEKQMFIQSGTYWDVAINVTNSGNYLLQTFGNLDTKMDLYSSDGITLITPSNDEGYDNNSLIYAYLNSNTLYHLKVRFYNPSTSGLTKLAITPTISYTEAGINTISDYDDILNIYTGSNINMNFNLTQYNSIVLTWTPFTSGNYTIRLDSIFDNYLYVINPTSTNYLRLDIDYNDDEYYYDDEDFERNAYLSNYYYSNITYFIIITQFDVSNNTGNNNTINLTIT